MLQPGDDDLIIPADVLAAPALGDEVDRLGRAPHEDDLVDRTGVQETTGLLAGRLVGIGRPGRQCVGRPVDVRVFVLVEVLQPVDHRLRFLRRRGIVQPDQRPTVDPFVQDRKIPPNCRHIKAAGREVPRIRQ